MRRSYSQIKAVLEKKALVHQDAGAAFVLAIILNLEDSEKDSEESKEWLKIAAELGSIDACDSLGFCYRQGWGFKYSNRKAYKYYKMACRYADKIKANAAHEAAAALIDIGLYGTKILNKNILMKGIKWLKRAANLGEPYSKRYLNEIKESVGDKINI